LASRILQNPGFSRVFLENFGNFGEFWGILENSGKNFWEILEMLFLLIIPSRIVVTPNFGEFWEILENSRSFLGNPGKFFGFWEFILEIIGEFWEILRFFGESW
jgi:hypothetical protein